MRSLRLRLPLLAMAVLAASLAVSAVLAYNLLLVAGYATLDDILERERDRFGRVIASSVEREPSPRAAVQEYLRLAPATQTYLTVVRLDGRTYRAARGPDELRGVRSIPVGPRDRLATLPSPAGDLRSLATRVRLDARTVAEVQVVAPLERIQSRTLGDLQWFLLAALISLAVGGAVLFLALRRTLTPLRDLAAAARKTELASLGGRVPEPRRDDEVASLAREFNTMLARLERAADSQREFMATVSHELRTPITVARGHVETLALQDPQAIAETAVVLREELSRMGRLVEDLMALARSGGEDFVRPARVDLPALFAEFELRLTGLAVEGVRVARPPAVTIEADGQRLAQALLNLVVNADVHTPSGTSVFVSCEIAHRWAAFTVRDDGPGMDDAIRRDAFQAFVTDGSPGSTGLGLAVVRAVAEGHGGDVALESGPGGTAVTLRVPARIEPRAPGSEPAGAPAGVA